MTSAKIKKQIDEYFPLLSDKQQALVLELVKSLLNIEADNKQISSKQYNIELSKTIDQVEDKNFETQEETIKKISKLKPMSISNFHEMINQAKLDHDSGRVTSQEDLKKKVKTWK